MSDHRHVTWSEVDAAAQVIADRWQGRGIGAVMPVPRGGCVPAAMVAERLGVPIFDGNEAPAEFVLVVDDLVDSGATRELWSRFPHFDALFRKSTTPDQVAPGATQLDGWLVFPWETGDEQAGPTDAVRRILQHVGEDPDREGLLDTPKRVVKAFGEMTDGYALDPAVVLGTTFDVGNCDELVLVTGIEFTSLCEHHLLPFVGTASVGYLPGARVVGLSKLARLVDLYAHRLQVQERLTTQVATAIMQHLDAQAAGVVITAHHSCMSCRGVRKPTARMTTSAMLGKLRDDPAMRAEFLRLVSCG